MKKFIILLATIVGISTPVYAGGNINDCYNCRITYNVTKKVVVKRVIPAPIPPAVIPVAPIAPGYVAPVDPNMSGPVFAAPYYEQPVAATTNGQCAWYVDPYDLFGQLFGSPDLVQSCW